MGYRLSKITTRTGDGGETGLANGTRVSKDSQRIVALGDVDELNSIIGLVLCEDLAPAVATALVRVQHDLFDLGGELSVPGHRSLTAEHVASLDVQLQRLNANLPPLRDFVLPGGTRGAALAHVARTVCRRAERSIVGLGRVEAVPEEIRMYLNRLSDLLFVIARSLNAGTGQGDVLWQPRGSGD